MEIKLICTSTSIAGNNAQTGTKVYESRLTNGRDVTIAIQSSGMLDVDVEYIFSLRKNVAENSEPKKDE